jgi:hypothetical protein
MALRMIPSLTASTDINSDGPGPQLKLTSPIGNNRNPTSTVSDTALC